MEKFFNNKGDENKMSLLASEVGLSRSIVIDDELAWLRDREDKDIISVSEMVVAELFHEEKNIIDKRYGLLSGLNKLFNRQISMMKGWLDDEVIAKFESQRIKVLITAYHNGLELAMKPYTAFLPVVPFSVASPELQLKQIKFPNNPNFDLRLKSLLDVALIKNLISGIPRNPYYIFGVRSGPETANKSFKEVNNFLKKIEVKRVSKTQKINIREAGGLEEVKEEPYYIHQSGLLVPEILSFAIFDEAMLTWSGIWAFAASCRVEHMRPCAPLLCIPGQNYLSLQAIATCHQNPGWIVPSCDSARRDFNQ